MQWQRVSSTNCGKTGRHDAEEWNFLVQYTKINSKFKNSKIKDLNVKHDTMGIFNVAFSSSLRAEVWPQLQPLMGDWNPCLQHYEEEQFCSHGFGNIIPNYIWLRLFSQLLILQVSCLHDAQWNGKRCGYCGITLLLKKLGVKA